MIVVNEHLHGHGILVVVEVVVMLLTPMPFKHHVQANKATKVRHEKQ